MRKSLLLVAISMTVVASSQAAVVHHVIAARGNPTPAGGTYITFGRPQLNSSRQVAFYAGVNNDAGFQEGIFLYEGTVGVPLALSGQAAPEGGNYSSFSNVYPIGLSENGQVVYVADLTDGFSNRGIFRHNGANATAVAVNFAPTPAGGVYNGVASPVLDDSGQAVFNSGLLGSSSDLGIFRNDGTATTTIALYGAAAPAGGNYSGLDSGYNSNGKGQVVFNMRLTGGSSSEGIFRHDGVAGVAIALRGAPAPGGGVYSNLNNPIINSNGDVVYGAQLESDGFDPGAIFRYTDQTGSTAVARPGDPAPPGGNYNGFFGLYDLNDAGEILYTANLTGSLSNEGLFRHDGVNPHTVALLGTAAPGTTTTFFSEFTGYETIRMNEDGVVVFMAELVGAGVTEANDRGYWYGTDANNLQLLVREGDTIFVNGANRTLRQLPFELDGFSMSETGIAWKAEFTDNTYAIIYTTFADLPGDYNSDGMVDAADYIVWRDTVGQTGAGLAADGDGSGTVDEADLAYWQARFGTTSGGGATRGGGATVQVPEPAGLLLLVSSVVCLTLGRLLRERTWTMAVPTGASALRLMIATPDQPGRASDRFVGLCLTAADLPGHIAFCVTSSGFG